MQKTWFRIDRARGVVIAGGRGTLTAEDVYDCIEAQSLHPDAENGFHVLWDLVNARLLMSVEEIEELSTRIAVLPNRAVAHKVAILAPNDITRRITELYPRIGAKSPVEYRSFAGRTQALEWLGLPADYTLWPDAENSPHAPRG